MNNNVKDNEKQERRGEYRSNLEINRRLWLEEEKFLIDEKQKEGYGDIHLNDFIQFYPDSEIGHAEFSKLLELQAKFKDLLERKQLLWPEDCVVDELNKKHAIIHIDQTYILTEKEDLIFGGIYFSLENRQSFRNLYENKIICCSDGKLRSKADVWLKSENRKEYLGVVFDPAKEGPVGDYYNIWKGFAKEPKQGDCSFYWNHVRNNICSGNEQVYKYVRKWISSVIQRPNIVHTSLVLCGSQGVGKNSFVEPLGVILGQHYLLLSSLHELVSNFNYHLKNAVLIHANEALWGGNKKEIGIIKSMITDETCLIEPKGKDGIRTKNFKHLIFSSNEDWPVFIDHDDRRFVVLSVSEARKEDHKYFDEVRKQLENGGYEALLYDLLHEDISDFNPRVRPNSEAAFSIKILSADPVEKYLFEVLKEGSLDIGNESPTTWWNKECEIKKDSIFNDFRAWCNKSNERRITKELFCKKLVKILPCISTARPSEEGRRVQVFVLPELERAKKDLEKYFKAGSEIWIENYGQASD